MVWWPISCLAALFAYSALRALRRKALTWLRRTLSAELRDQREQLTTVRQFSAFQQAVERLQH